MVTAGAMSSSGRNTKARSCMRGCGTVSRVDASRRRPSLCCWTPCDTAANSQRDKSRAEGAYSVSCRRKGRSRFMKRPPRRRCPTLMCHPRESGGPVSSRRAATRVAPQLERLAAASWMPGGLASWPCLSRLSTRSGASSARKLAKRPKTFAFVSSYYARANAGLVFAAPRRGWPGLKGSIGRARSPANAISAVEVALIALAVGMARFRLRL